MKIITLFILACFCSLHAEGQSGSVTVNIDGARKYQRIDGFGVNINTAWWYEGVYTGTSLMQPAIDLLADSLEATLFRAVIEEIDWEAVNDDNDPDHFNMSYYNQVFSSQKFNGIWETLRYLNRKGITDGLIISLMGSAPAPAPLDAKDTEKSWMGGTDYSIDPVMEDEFVESIAALLHYARFTAKIQFSLVSPMNETDVISMTKSTENPDGIVEGPNIPDAAQFVRITRKLAKKLDVLGMDDIRFVVADAAGDKLFMSFLDEMVKDKYLLDKVAHWGVHQYGSSAENYRIIAGHPANPNKSLWVTEMAGIGNLLGQLSDSAHAFIFWDGFDCVYQHARRNGYGSNPPNDWVFWYGPEEGKPLIEYLPSTNSWTPRKQFFQFAHIFKFVKPGAVRIGSSGNDSSLVVQSFLNPNGQLVIAGRHTGKDSITWHGTLKNLPAIDRFSLICTTPDTNLQSFKDQIVVNNSLEIRLPSHCIFTLTGQPDAGSSRISVTRPEPADWFAGDMHVHRNCGDVTGILDESEFTAMMEHNDLSVISVLADMGNGEVKDSRTDLPKVTGKDAVQSLPGRIVHWDAEWHFDPAGVTFEHKALGGHLVLLGLTEAHTLWDESPYNILAWGKAQQAVVGFCHMQYLRDSLSDDLDCCTPLEFPVEAALGTIDFLAEDVWINDASVNAYYKLLNCGFRLSWAAGTDFPCNNSEPFGTQLTYVQIKDQHLSYDKWITGIRDGRTVVSTNGHEEFIALQVNGKSTPGDEIELVGRSNIPIEVKWTSARDLSGSIEILCNGKVVASLQGTSRPGEPVILCTSVDCSQSSWICARRMDEKGHRLHTAPVYVSVNKAPVRASAEDARYFVNWIDQLLAKTVPGEAWSNFFTNNPDAVRDRYRKARDIYERIAQEAAELQAATSSTRNQQDAPVLILGTDRSFGTYTAEIMKAEGFNEFHLDSLSGNKVSASFLQGFKLVILAEPDPDPRTIQLIYNYVEKGGNLIAFCPHPAFSELFGITRDIGNLTGGTLRIDTTSEQGLGLSGKNLQLHVPGDPYALAGGVPVAFFTPAEASRDSNPAVVYHPYKRGHAIAFLYNLPQNIVYTRQGNPSYAGIEKDSIHGLRAMDLFADGWVDTSNNTINQADEQMALLSHCIETIDKDNLTLPRFWYFPDTLKCLITLTNDGEYKTEADFEPQFRDVDSLGATMSIYLLGVDKVSREWVEKWTARGFEISGHPDNTREAGNPHWHSMDSALRVRKNEIRAAYQLPMRTIVNHWFVWCGREADGNPNFAAQAKLEEINGIALDANYAHYDMNSNQGDSYLGTPGTRQGNFTGSGLVMKYADARGKIINVYQHLNAVYDQQYNERHDPEGFYNCLKGLVDRSLHNEVYSIIGIKSHNDEYYFSKKPLMQMLDYARMNKIPVWTESRLLDFLTMKDQAAFTGIERSRDQLKFVVNVPMVQEQSLTLMVPYHTGGRSINGITGNSKALNYIDRRIKGTRYVLVPVVSGQTHAIAVSYGN